MSKEERIAQFTQRLKTVRNEQDMLMLVKEMGQTDDGFFLHGKRRGYHAYSFSVYPYNTSKCHYLYEDGASTGLCRWENLWKVLEVRG